MTAQVHFGLHLRLTHESGLLRFLGTTSKQELPIGLEDLGGVGEGFVQKTGRIRF